MKIYVTEVLVVLFIILAWILFVSRLQQWYSRYSRFCRLMSEVPGPKTLPLFGNTYEFVTNPLDRFVDMLTELTNQYGPIFRAWIGPFICTVHVSSWKYAESIFNSSVHIDKSSSYSFLHSWMGTGLLTSTGAKWHLRRKLLTPAFHRSVLDSFQEVFSDKCDSLLKILEVERHKSEVLDIAPYIWQCSLDIICETAMGTKINIQGNVSKKDAAYLKSISFYKTSWPLYQHKGLQILKLEMDRSAGESGLYRIIRPWLHPQLFFNISPRGQKYKKSVEIMHSFSNKVIQERKKEYLESKRMKVNGVTDENEELRIKKRRMAFIDLLIETALANGEENTHHLTDEGIREEVDTFMFEGHDTTASCISWTIYLLGRHPEIQEEVAKEINEVFRQERITSTQKLSELRLLDRCIRESLRIYPSVPSLARKLNEDVKLGEYTLPAGTELFINMFYMHRDKELFPEPEKFNPDNFLPEACEKRPPYAFAPFSAGPRNCIGQKFAMQEAKTVVASIVKKYRIESIQSPQELVLLMELVLRSANGIKVHLHPRN